MRLYNYWPADLPHSNWLMHTEEREAIVPNPPYDRLICPRCLQFSYDDVFALGFEDIKCYELFSGRSFGFFVVAGFFPNSRAEIMFCNQIAVNWS